MKVAIFLPNLDGGGAERAMLNLGNALVGRGMLVDLVLCQIKGPYLKSIADGVKVIDFRKRHVCSALVPLTRYLRKTSPDVLISALDHANVVALAAKCLSCSLVRCVVTVHGVYSYESRHKRSFKALFVRMLMKCLYSRADAIVAVSKGCADELVRVAGFPSYLVHCIYNPVIDSRLSALSRATVNHPFFINATFPIILGVGSLTILKDFATLVKVFARVRELCPCRLIILGQGPERKNIERLICELGLELEISLMGFVENPFAYMARSSVFVVPSKSESMSMVIVEALSLGVPVVATNCDYGPREILDHGAFGRLTPVGDEQAMVVAIHATLTDSRRNEVPAEALRPFTVDGATDEYVHLIRELTE